MFFNLRICCQIKIYLAFFRLICILWHFLQKWLWIRKSFINFKIYWNNLMKILYLKGYSWLLSQNQRVKKVFLGYRWYRALAKRVKKNIKLKGRRSSHRRCSVRKIVLRNFAEFTGKHLCQSLCWINAPEDVSAWAIIFLKLHSVWSESPISQ